MPTATRQALLDRALDRIRRNADLFGGRFPTVGQGDTYLLSDNDNWLAAFWTGLLWLAYAATGDEAFRSHAEALRPSFARRLADQVHITHDLGFLYTLSARAEWQLTGSEDARRLALEAAAQLAARYRPVGRYIQAWGPVGDPDEGGRIIIDTLMNLPLLFWAAAQTGDAGFHRFACDHADCAAAHLVREDASTAHTCLFDQDTGALLGVRTHQGYADDSMWARGQAWGIYGFALAAAWTGRADYLALAERIAARFLAELPPDGVPRWDLRLPPGAPQHPDTSAGAIAAGGMFRLAALVDPPQGDVWRGRATALLDALATGYAEDRPTAQGLLRGGTYHTAKRLGVNEYFICGDYFYFEALLLSAGRCPDLWGPGAAA